MNNKHGQFTKKSLIFVNLGGMLVCDGKLNSYSANVIKKANAAGHKVCIVTNRGLLESIKFYQELELDTPIITFNGGFVSNPSEMNKCALPIVNFNLSKSVVENLLNNPFIKQNIENGVLQNSRTIRFIKKDKMVDFYEKRLTNEVKICYGSDELENEYNSVLIKFKSETDDNEIINLFDKNRNTLQLSSYLPREKIAIVHSAITRKELSTEAVRVLLNFHNSETIAFGDGYSDISLLKASAFAITVPNASLAVRLSVNKISRYTCQDGIVGRELEKILQL